MVHQALTLLDYHQCSSPATVIKPRCIRLDIFQYTIGIIVFRNLKDLIRDEFIRRMTFVHEIIIYDRRDFFLGIKYLYELSITKYGKRLTTHRIPPDQIS